MEYEFHLWLKKQGDDRPNTLGIGDDAAVMGLEPDRRSIVVATDAIAEGTHFLLPQHDLELVGRKALAVNLSDIAAMGATPETAVLNFQLPKSFDLEMAKLLFLGAKELANQFGVAIIGGDTNRWEGKLVVGATVIGTLPTASHGWPIGGAQVGDSIIVSGDFGGSIHGRHLSFEPRVKLAQYLFENYEVNAATDASDSLSLDMYAMIKQSGFGIDLDLDAIPISSDVESQTSKQRIEHALNDGEDFELILSMPPEEANRLLTDSNLAVPVTKIGEVMSSSKGLQGRVGDVVKPISPEGFIH